MWPTSRDSLFCSTSGSHARRSRHRARGCQPHGLKNSTLAHAGAGFSVGILSDNRRQWPQLENARVRQLVGVAVREGLVAAVVVENYATAGNLVAESIHDQRLAPAFNVIKFEDDSDAVSRRDVCRRF